jgi:polysaccharide deacetylase family protein (PEP-CTERM system associated)
MQAATTGPHPSVDAPGEHDFASGRRERQGASMNNAFTVDVEDYFHVTAFADAIDRRTWNTCESRVERNTRALLDLLTERGVRATFFVLGWVAQRHPQLVRDIAGRGHEIASHGLSHQLIYRQSKTEFRQETRYSKQLLEDIVQRTVIGYRAATYSITPRSLWALDILVEEGFLYDSSIFPMRHDKYGIPDAPTTPHRITTEQGNCIAEFPISVVRINGVTLPVGGGGYFRILPYGLTKWGLDTLNGRGQEFVFYIHPWEIDPRQPRIEQATSFSRFRHYSNLHKCYERLSTLLQDFSFGSVEGVLRKKELLPATAIAAETCARAEEVAAV